MDFALVITNAEWQPAVTVPMGTALIKGRNGLYDEITAAAARVPNRFGCYCWRNADTVFYCGSFARDYKTGNYKSNLQGRVQQYLQNHSVKPTGNKNTNLMVFEEIQAQLKKTEVTLAVFTFGRLQIGGEVVPFDIYSENPDLVHLVEQLLMSTYRKEEQCQWNRT